MTFFFQLKPAASVHLLEIWLCLESHLGVHATRRTDQHCDSGTARRIATGTKLSQIIFWNIEELSQFRH